ncbi:MAG: hypothetical protein POELPBGB_01865 [Bacteroidia bacterium]|nr:hypothetical protein [Bacteroidia bacterium]
MHWLSPCLRSVSSPALAAPPPQNVRILTLFLKNNPYGPIPSFRRVGADREAYSTTLCHPAVTLCQPAVTLCQPSVTLRHPAITLRCPAITLWPPAITLRPGLITLCSGHTTLRSGFITLRHLRITLSPGFATEKPPRSAACHQKKERHPCRSSLYSENSNP